MSIDQNPDRAGDVARNGLVAFAPDLAGSFGGDGDEQPLLGPEAAYDRTRGNARSEPGGL